MTALYHLLYRLTRWSVWLCGFSILGATFLIFAEIVFRNFNRSIYLGSAEISGYVFAIAVTWGFSFCLFERAHVRIDIGYRFLPSAGRLALDVLGLVALGLFASVLAWRATQTLEETLLFDAVSRTPLQVPLWIPQSVWAAGLVFFAANCLFLVVYIAALVLRAGTDAASPVYAITGATEGQTELDGATTGTERV